VVTVLPFSWIRGSVDVLVKLESLTMRKRLVMSNVLPVSLTSGPARVTVAGPGVPGSVETLESSMRIKLLIMLKVLGLDWTRGVVPVPISFPLSETAMRLLTEIVLPLAMRSGPPSSAVVGGFGAARERRTVKKLPVAVRVLLSKLISGAASPTNGFGGPVSFALSPINRNVRPTKSGLLAVMLVLFIALRRGPARVKVGGSCAVRLDISMVRSPVLTVLPLN
jgi:hypothetical protein